MASKIQIKRGLEANRSSLTPDIGELIITTDTKKIYFGSGSVAGGHVFTASLAELAEHALTASYLLGGTTSSAAISSSYAQSATNADTASYVRYTGVDTVGSSWVSASAQVLIGCL